MNQLLFRNTLCSPAPPSGYSATAAPRGPGCHRALAVAPTSTVAPAVVTSPRLEFSGHPAALPVHLKAANSAFDSWSASLGPVREHLVTFRISTLHPSAAATVLSAFTMVVDSRHQLLYPLCQIRTTPALSTQMFTGHPLQLSAHTTRLTCGPISSRAVRFLPTFFPSTFHLPLLIPSDHCT